MKQKNQESKGKGPNDFTGAGLSPAMMPKMGSTTGVGPRPKSTKND